MTSPSRRLFLAAVTAMSLAGCRRKHKFSSADLDHAKKALQTCLESWKKGEPLDKLRSAAEPIDFVEEGPRDGLKLIGYEIAGDEFTDREAIRFTVKLTVEDKRGRREERRATYAVALRSPIAIGRDPMY